MLCWKRKQQNIVTSDYVDDHDGDYDARLDAPVVFCSVARTRDEMMASQFISSPSYFRQHYFKPLLESGRIKMTIPDKPKSKNQKYVKA